MLANRRLRRANRPGDSGCRPDYRPADRVAQQRAGIAIAAQDVVHHRDDPLAEHLERTDGRDVGTPARYRGTL